MIPFLAFAQQRGLEVVARELGGEYAKPGKQYVVFIAIDKYLNWLPLRNPVKDAREIKTILSSRYFVDETIELYDGDATKSGILKLFDRLVKNTNPDDSVFIYYAGHAR